MLAAQLVVEVHVLQKYLADAVFRLDELAVGVHEDGLSLRGVVGLVLFSQAAELVPGAVQVIQTADFRRAAGNQNHTRAQIAAQTLENVVVNFVFGLLDQRHGADFYHQIKCGHEVIPLSWQNDGDIIPLAQTDVKQACGVL